jgi:ABC-2 type transport system ATP-binding protein
MLKLKKLTKRYKDLYAVKDLTFEIKKGEVFGILGPNGAGKSTMIKMLTCFHKPTSGDALVDGVSIRDKNSIKRLIGWVPQEESFYFKLTVYENLKYFGTLYGMTKKEIDAKAKELLELLQIQNKRDAIAGSLSGGMKRRLSIAIALMHDPKLLYLDEPTAGVDPLSRMALWEVIKNIKKRGMTILFCTHYLDEADLLCDRIAVLRAGQVVIIDTPASLKKKYGKSLEEAFVNLLSKEDAKTEVDEKKELKEIKEAKGK